MTISDNFTLLAPKSIQMEKQAQELASLGNELDKIISANYSFEEGAFSGLVLPILKSMVEQCKQAPSLLHSRLEELFQIHNKSSYSSYVTFSGTEKSTRFWSLAGQCEDFISSDGSKQFKIGLQAFDKNATQSKSQNQLHLLKQLVVLGTGVVSHPVGTVLHAGEMLTKWEELKKDKQLELGLIQISIALLALDKLYENVENLCLFMHFIPISSDGKNAVTESVARARFRMSVGL